MEIPIKINLLKLDMFITLMIMRDVNNGWAVRYTHANTASFFFIFVYAQTQFYLVLLFIYELLLSKYVFRF